MSRRKKRHKNVLQVTLVFDVQISCGKLFYNLMGTRGRGIVFNIDVMSLAGLDSILWHVKMSTNINVLIENQYN